MSQPTRENEKSSRFIFKSATSLQWNFYSIRSGSELIRKQALWENVYHFRVCSCSESYNSNHIVVVWRMMWGCGTGNFNLLEVKYPSVIIQIKNVSRYLKIHDQCLKNKYTHSLDLTRNGREQKFKRCLFSLKNTNSKSWKTRVVWRCCNSVYAEVGKTDIYDSG